MMATEASVRSIGTFAGGSYGYGDPAGCVELFVIDCDGYRRARSEHTVGAVEPYVYGSEAEARRHLRGESVLATYVGGGSPSGWQLVAGPMHTYEARARKLSRYRYEDVRLMSRQEAERIGLIQR
jgi:hypothetical protein